MIEHRVERHQTKLRVTIDLDLAEVVSALQHVDSGYVEQLERYCAARVVPDVLEVAEILSREDATLGVVKWFSDARGYGFIRSYDGRDVFVHHTGIAAAGYRTLQQGQRVRFKCREGRQLSAIDVTLVDADDSIGL